MPASSEALLAILYDLSQATVGETRPDPLLRRVLQRLLYHTSFPVGVALRHVDQNGSVGPMVEVGPSIGDRSLTQAKGSRVALTHGALAGALGLRLDAPLAAALGARPALRCCLELPVDGTTTLALLSLEPPQRPLPWAELFEPVMGSLSRALRLCTENERLGAELRHELQVRTEAERQAREAKEQAEAANRAKSAFLANMSHEIRTPMNAILGFTHLLQRETTDPRQLDKLHKIGTAAEHLLGLLNDVLDLSKIEAGRLILEEGRVELRAAFDHALSMVTDRARTKGVTLRQELDPKLDGLQLLGDALRLKQVLLNLVSNAIKFTEDGSVTLRAAVLETTDEHIAVRVEVEDTGVGIPEEVVPRLFSAFEQGRQETARVYGGTGLGLAICRRLVHMMGGEIGVESRLGAGSRFWFTARLRRGTAQPGTRRLATRLRRGARVLVVDDNPINREMAVELLESFGLRVTAAAGGAEAIERFREGGVQLILLDKEMPQMDGPAVARRLRALPGGDLPILAWTANTFELDRRQCMEAGMDDFLPKPIEPRLLHAILARWLPDTQGEPADEAPPVPPDVPDLRCEGGWTPAVLSLETAVAFLGGSRDRALHYLGRFPQDHHADAARVRGLARSDRPAASAAAHGLGGLAVSLGLEALARAASRVAHALRNPTPTPEEDALLADLDSALAETLRAIHSAIEACGLGGPLQERVQAELGLLEALLEADDAHAVEVWARVEGPLGAWVGEPTLAPVRAAINRFDFDAALGLLAGIRRA